jgi:hypothetical protein
VGKIVEDNKVVVGKDTVVVDKMVEVGNNWDRKKNFVLVELFHKKMDNHLCYLLRKQGKDRRN